MSTPVLVVLVACSLLSVAVAVAFAVVGRRYDRTKREVREQYRREGWDV